MGRSSELIWFLNSEKTPSDLETRHRYRYLSITDDLKKFRRQYRAELKAREKGLKKSSRVKKSRS